MTLLFHRVVASVSFMCVAVFLIATVVVEIFGNYHAVSEVKSLIVFPGLFILVPCIAFTGASGVVLLRSRSGKLARQKKKRMPFIAANGILVLIPCALFLSHCAAAGNFDGYFYTAQGIELIAGTTNLILMGLNIRDGLIMNGRYRGGYAGSSIG